jgi:hypothetical protein
MRRPGSMNHAVWQPGDPPVPGHDRAMPTAPPFDEQAPSRRSVIRLGAGLAAAGVTATAIAGVFGGFSPGGSTIDTPDEGTLLDHAYTTDPDDRDALIEQGYADLTGCNGFLYVFREQVVSAEVSVSRLHRLYHSSYHDHAYTPYTTEYEAFLDQGYQDESDRDPMWLLMLEDAAQAPPGAKQLYRLFNPDVIDNYYTTSAADAQRAVDQLGYQREWPNSPFPFVFGGPAVANGTATARLYQLCHPGGETPATCLPT